MAPNNKKNNRQKAMLLQVFTNRREFWFSNEQIICLAKMNIHN